MRNVVVLAVSVFALTACSKSIPQDGFKQLKYGMTLAQLRALGFNCKADDLCSRDSSAERDETETLFGHPATVRLWTEKGLLKSIDVNVDIPQNNLAEEMVKAFGSPKSFDYTTIRGGRATQLIWQAPNGTSLSMVRSPDVGSAYSQNFGSLSYNGKAETATLLAAAVKAGVKADDF